MCAILKKNNMSNSDNSGNKLFLVCPFCHMEYFIKKHYGEVFFLTAPAGIFNFEEEYLEMVKYFIGKENIKDIYLVSENSCSFISHALQKKDLSGLECESELKNMIEPGDTSHSISRKLLFKQMKKLSQNNLFGNEIAEGKLSVYKLLTDKNIDQITKLN